MTEKRRSGKKKAYRIELEKTLINRDVKKRTQLMEKHKKNTI